MAKHTRIYTRTGDEGMTGLIGGGRAPKNDPRIEAYGTVDELSSIVGVARAALAATPLREEAAAATARDLDGWLAWTQDALFNLGCELATPAAGAAPTPAVTPADIAALERAIDRAEDDLKPLSTFIHPGGSLAGAYLHQARTVARRAERLVVTLAEREPVSADARRYLNRLSDALFVWSRWINHALQQTEHTWDPETRPPA
jgi:cob(I)alamin adenosyltransferase